MKNMTLNNIAEAVNGKLYYADRKLEAVAEGVVLDSRLVEKDFVFVATVGERVDGHDFIQGVFEKGALAVICEKLPEKEYGPCILVENSFDALRAAAKYYRSQLDLKIVGITGSVGKTSTKEFVAGVLSEKYSVLKTQGNFNNEIGVPLTLLRIRDNHEVAVVEMGINHFGEMTRLTDMVKPDIAVITNIGECHLEFLNDRDGVLRAKTEIFAGLSLEGDVVLNGDDDKLATVKHVNGKPVNKIGIDGEDLDYKAVEINDNGLLGSSFTLDGTDMKIRVPLPGKHMIYNALTATAVAKLLGMDACQIVSGIEKLQSVGGRSNIIKNDRYTIIDDCYNANPTSVKAAVDMLLLANDERVAILGDMFELGENENELHSEVGAYVAIKNIDTLICIGKLSKHMYDAAVAGGAKAYYFEEKDRAVSQLESIINKGSSILIKASHGMHFEEIVEKLK